MNNEKTIDTSKEQRYKKLCDEYKELSGKITRLDAFVNDLFFKTTVPDEEERVFMLGQLFHMRGYRDNLKERISKLWEQIKSDRTNDEDNQHHCGQDTAHYRTIVESQGIHIHEGNTPPEGWGNLKSLLGMECIGITKAKCQSCPQDHYGTSCVKLELVGGAYICLAPNPQDNA